MFCLLFQAPLL